MNNIQEVRAEEINLIDYPLQFTSCVVLTSNKQFLLQKRPDDWWTYPGYICLFGGKVEEGESAPKTIIRELKEELGATVKLKSLHYLGAITESISNHKELIHEFFWFDESNTITGCYEANPIYFDNVDMVLAQNKLIDDVPWAISRCMEKGLI